MLGRVPAASLGGMLVCQVDGYTQTARTGRSNQVASLWDSMPKSTKNHTKSGFGAKLKSSKTHFWLSESTAPQMDRETSSPGPKNKTHGCLGHGKADSSLKMAS